MGAFIGEALGVGPHWFYDIEEQKKHYGDWISDYTEPLPGRYHDGLKAGESSQNGIILKLMIEALIESGDYNEDIFKEIFEKELFNKIDGTPVNGPGGYTSQSIRDAYLKWRDNDKKWVRTYLYIKNILY